MVPLTYVIPWTMSSIRVLSQACNYGTLNDSLLRDKIVCGITKETTRKKLLADPKLTLDKAVNICRADESAEIQATEISRTADVEHVHKVRFNPNHGNRVKRYPGQLKKDAPPNVSREQINNCKFCGGKHAWMKEACPAYGKTCDKYKRRNHFASCCKTSMPIRQVEESQESSQEFSQEFNEYEYNIGQVNVTKAVGNKNLCAELFINDKPVIFQLDTGASACLIRKKYIGETRITPTTTSLVMWNSSKLQPLGECILKVTNKKTKT